MKYSTIITLLYIPLFLAILTIDARKLPIATPTFFAASVLAGLCGYLITSSIKKERRDIALIVGSVLFYIGFAITIFSFKGSFFLLSITTFMIFGCLIYLIVPKDEISREINLNFSNLKFFTLNLTFIISYLLSIFVLEKSVFARPYSYYAFILICIAITAIEIFFVKKDRMIYLNLLKSYLIAINLRIAPILLSNYGFGDDFRMHMAMIDYILKYNHIAPYILHVYAYFPGSHILVSFGKILSSLPDILSVIIFNQSINALIIFIIFLIVRELLDIKKALLSALLLSFAGFNIYISIISISQSLANFLAFFSFYLVIKIKLQRKLQYSIIFIFIFSALVVIHQITALILTLFITSVFMYETFREKNPLKSSLFLILLIVATVLFSYWTYITVIFFSDTTSTIIRLLYTEPLRLLPSFNISDIWGSLFEFIGISFVFFFFVFTILTLYRKNLFEDRFFSFFCIPFIFLFIIFYFSTLIGISAVMYDRWLIFVEFFVTSMAANGVWLFSKNLKKVSVLVTIAVILLISFFQITTSYVSLDLHPWTKIPFPVPYTKDSYVYSTNFIKENLPYEIKDVRNFTLDPSEYSARVYSREEVRIKQLSLIAERDYIFISFPYFSYWFHSDYVVEPRNMSNIFFFFNKRILDEGIHLAIFSKKFGYTKLYIFSLKEKDTFMQELNRNDKIYDNETTSIYDM